MPSRRSHQGPRGVQAEATRTLAGCEAFAARHSGGGAGSGGGGGGGGGCDGGGGGGGQQPGAAERTGPPITSADLARLRREVASLQAESDEQLSIVHGLVAAGQA